MKIVSNNSSSILVEVLFNILCRYVLGLISICTGLQENSSSNMLLDLLLSWIQVFMQLNKYTFPNLLIMSTKIFIS